MTTLEGNAPHMAEASEPNSPSDNGSVPGSLDKLLDVSVPVVIEFGRTSMMLQDVLELGPGSVIQLDRMVGEPIDVYVSDRRLAAGEVVVVDEHFGIRITDILGDSDGGAKE